MKNTVRRISNTNHFTVKKADGINLIINNKKYVDMTSGYAACVTLGYNNKKVISSIKEQMKKFSYLSNLEYKNEKLEILSKILVKKEPSKLNAVWYSGCSGSESIEAALKLSFLYHETLGNSQKKIFLSRDQSFHGNTLLANGITNIPIYDVYDKIIPTNLSIVNEHNKFKYGNKFESEEKYTDFEIKNFEKKILSIGPENISSFVAETISGQIVGDVTPSKNYWKKIRKICKKYNIHLILDEIYSGLGRSGKYYCIDHDEIEPDFLCVGKTLSAGYGPISAVITNRKITEKISKKFGRIPLGSTYDAHPLAVAASIEVQKISKSKELLKNVQNIDKLIKEQINYELSSHSYFKNVRGRGALQSFEYNAKNQIKFNKMLQDTMFNKYNVIIQCRYHRTIFHPPSIISIKVLERIISQYIEAFKKCSQKY